jgi:hypothetical protein
MVWIFVLYNPTHTDAPRGSYVTLYMNPDTMDFKPSMFIPGTTSAIGKLCPNQRRVPQLVCVCFDLPLSLTTNHNNMMTRARCSLRCLSCLCSLSAFPW